MHCDASSVECQADWTGCPDKGISHTERKGSSTIVRVASSSAMLIFMSTALYSFSAAE